MSCIFVLLVFVFFKQKTAYEMRISDWSSDVCSSDLRQPAEHGAEDAEGKLQLAHPDVCSIGVGAERRVVRASASRTLETDATVVELLDEGPTRAIGRASCRERVCQNG